jgi:Ca-activated chloride channel family protein
MSSTIRVSADVNRYFLEPDKPHEIFILFEIFYPDILSEDTLKLVKFSNRKPAKICFCIDVSGSMKDEGKIDIAKKAVIDYIQKIEPTDYIAVVTFERKAKVAVPLQPAVNKVEIASKISNLKTGTYTNLSDGIRLAYSVIEGVEVEQEKSLLDKLLGRKTSMIAYGVTPPQDTIKRIILLTDGIPTIGELDPEYYEKIGEQFKRLGITIVAVGIGVEYDERILASLCTASGGFWRHILKAEEVQEFFQESFTELKSVALTNPTLFINPFQGVEILEVYRIGAAISRLTDMVRRDGGIEIPLEDVRVGVKQRIAVKANIKPLNVGKHSILRYTIAGEDFELSKDLAVEVVSDRDLYSIESNPQPRLQFALAEYTKLLEKNLENKEIVDKIYCELKSLISSSDYTYVKSDEDMTLMTETLLKTSSQILGSKLSEENIKKLREEITVLKSRGG